MLFVIGAGEISAGKFSKIENSRSIVCSRSFDYILEVSQRYSLLHHSDTRTPRIDSIVKIYASVSTCIAFIFFSIGHILRATGNAQIAATVVKRILIAVIDIFPTRESHNLSMHPYNAAFFFSSDIESLRVLVPNSEPIPSTQTVVIDSINESDLILRYGDKTIKWIKRLLHLLTQVAHGITSIVQRVAAPNYINSTMLEAA